MASVPLSFVPPTEEGIVALRIFESDNPDTGFTQIDRVLAGTYPDYITRYTTPHATRVDDWFAIAWENAEGVISPLSGSIKGGTTTLVGELVDRVMLRIPNEDENIVLQEAEATVSFVYKVDDPYTVDYNTVNRLWLTELTNLTLVASQYVSVITKSSAGEEYTAGMVSQGTPSGVIGNVLEGLEKLEKRALKRLGIGGSLIATIVHQHDHFTFAAVKTSFDSSRVLSARAVITEHMILRDLDSGIVISDR